MHSTFPLAMRCVEHTHARTYVVTGPSGQTPAAGLVYHDKLLLPTLMADRSLRDNIM